MLKELKDHLHPALKRQWESLYCECGLRPSMKLSLSEKNYQKIFLTCGMNQRGVEAFGKERCRQFPVDPLETVRPKTAAAGVSPVHREAVEGRVRGRRELKHHLVSRRIQIWILPRTKSVYDGMKEFPEWKRPFS